MYSMPIAYWVTPALRSWPARAVSAANVVAASSAQVLAVVSVGESRHTRAAAKKMLAMTR